MKERETLGEFLKREREQKNISLGEMAKHTKVREHFLKAIEEDRYDLLPSPIYGKGFLSAYAKYVGLDSREVLLRYERTLKGKEIIPSKAKLSTSQPKGRDLLKVDPGRRLSPLPSLFNKLKALSFKSKGKAGPGAVKRAKSERKSLKVALSNRKQTGMISGIIAISLLISYFLHPYLSGPPVGSPPEKPKAGESLPIIPTTQTQEVSPSGERKPFSLEIKAIEETWVKIQIDGLSQAEALFKPGEGSSYQGANRIELLVGNAGGLDMAFNGRKLERFGKPGEVVTLVFTPQGVERK